MISIKTPGLQRARGTSPSRKVKPWSWRSAGQLVTGAGLLFTSVLSGCATLPGTVAEKVDEHRTEYVLVRNGPQVVVFENGLGAKLGNWDKVFTEISKNTTAFAYNRPGYGASDPAATPRDGEHIVEELRGLLKSKGLQPPYVLVGHSAGGLYMQWFARRHPEEVAGLVLVDSTHPQHLQGKGSPEHWPGWVRAGFGILTAPSAQEELKLLNATGESVLALPTFTGKPVMVLSALKPMAERSETADYVNEKRRDVVNLYPGAKQLWINSGHNIQRKQPEAVIEAIRGVLGAVGRQVSLH
ncbi:alpha/beta fold hydrolase [Azohydromonas australica]|uniref:alpha/beta fold hydrolase n=1 Tax=Azohydromonas australica TaxID=364039 RepID=UPI0003FAEDB6|nr:alpha/beta hydrolase [Azohydromonas australica]